MEISNGNPERPEPLFVWLWATDQAGALDVRLEDLCDPDEAKTPAGAVDWEKTWATSHHIYVVAAARHGAAGSAVLPRVPSETSRILAARADLGGVDAMIQPSLLAGGWIEMKDGDESCRTIFDRHYSRRVYADGRKPKQFIGPGVKHPLMLADGRALFAWRKHISDDGQTGVNCAIFRNEGDELASMLIRQAVEIARQKWWPNERFYTYIDPRKVPPTMFRGYPVWGWCFYKAGWKYAGIGKGGKHVLALEPVALRGDREAGCSTQAVCPTE